MSSFIQELRLLSNSSTISSISSTSNDSGFSTSYCGDSNVGSGQAPATTLVNNTGHQQQFNQAIGGTFSIIHQQSASPASAKLGTAGSPVLSSAVWGNKSLWGPAPSPLATASAAATSTMTSALVSPATIKSPPVLPSAATVTNPTSNALYTSISKELYSPWATPTASASIQSPSVGTSNSHFPPSMSSSQMQSLSTLAPGASQTPSKPSSSLAGNNGTNIWESKLGLIESQQSLEPFGGSIWQAPGHSSAPNQVPTAATGSNGAWQCDVTSGGSNALPSAVRSHFVRPQENLCDGIAIDTTPKLSSLWTATPWSTAGSVTENAGGSCSVLRSLRMGSAESSMVKPASNDGGGHSASNNDVVCSGFTPAASAMSTNNSSSLAMFSEEVTSYWNMFN